MPFYKKDENGNDIIPIRKEIKSVTNSKIAKLLDKHGMTDSVLMKKLKSKLTAKRTLVVGQGAGATTVDVDDNQTQMKALEIALRMKDLLDTESKAEPTKLVIQGNDKVAVLTGKGNPE